MQKDLELLEEKVSSLLELCQQWQQDNLLLQQKIDLLHRKNQALEKKIIVAKARLEGVIMRLLPGVNDGK